MPSLQHMAALGGNNDTGWEGRWCEPDEALGLKRQRGRNESRTGQTVKWQHGTRTGAGRSDFSIHIKSSVYTYTHTHTHDGFIQTTATLWTSCLEILSSLWEVLLRFSSYLLYRCLLRLWGTVHRAQLCTVSGSFLTCGMMLLETKWILFMWALLQRAWPRACPRPGSAPLCSGLATKCISLSCGPWPPDAFPDPGNRINTSARALGSHSRVHSCPLARPSPVRPG